MCLHEKKNCPRCGNTFECKPGNVSQCECFGLQFTEEEKAFIEQRYNDCICRTCLLQLKNQVELFKEKFICRQR